MSRRDRIPKTLDQQLRDLDDSLYLLRRELDGLRGDPAHLKSIGTLLRALVCTSSGTEGLLWRVAEAISVPDTVALQGVGSLDPDHPLARSMAFHIVPLFRAGYGAPQLEAHEYSLRDVLENTEAVFIRGKSMTFDQLIKSVSQQLGSAHESEGVDRELINLGAIFLQGKESYVGVLTTVADLALEVGERVLHAAEASASFSRSVRRPGYGDLTVAVRIQLLETLAGRAPVIRFDAPRAGVEVLGLAGPTHWTFSVEQDGVKVHEVAIPYPSDFEPRQDIVFSAAYSSRNSAVLGAANGVFAGEPEELRLGWVHGHDFSHVTPQGDRRDVVAIQFATIFEGWLSSERLDHLRVATREEVSWATQAAAQGHL